MVNEDIATPETEAVVPSPVLYKFTNQEDSAYMDSVLAMFYQGIYSNTVGIMTAFNVEKQEEELILVGVQFDSDGKAECFPIAKCFSAEDTRVYLSPDGLGGYYDPNDPYEVAEAKENMRSYAEAVSDYEGATA